MVFGASFIAFEIVLSLRSSFRETVRKWNLFWKALLWKFKIQNLREQKIIPVYLGLECLCLRFFPNGRKQ